MDNTPWKLGQLFWLLRTKLVKDINNQHKVTTTCGYLPCFSWNINDREKLLDYFLFVYLLEYLSNTISAIVILAILAIFAVLAILEIAILSNSRTLTMLAL